MQRTCSAKEEPGSDPITLHYIITAKVLSTGQRSEVPVIEHSSLQLATKACRECRESASVLNHNSMLMAMLMFVYGCSLGHVKPILR